MQRLNEPTAPTVWVEIRKAPKTCGTGAGRPERLGAPRYMREPHLWRGQGQGHGLRHHAFGTGRHGPEGSAETGIRPHRRRSRGEGVGRQGREPDGGGDGRAAGRSLRVFPSVSKARSTRPGAHISESQRAAEQSHRRAGPGPVLRSRRRVARPARRAGRRGPPVKLRFEIEGDFLVHPGGEQLLGARRRALVSAARALRAVLHVPRRRCGSRSRSSRSRPGKTVRRVEEGGRQRPRDRDRRARSSSRSSSPAKYSSRRRPRRRHDPGRDAMRSRTLGRSSSSRTSPSASSSSTRIPGPVPVPRVQHPRDQLLRLRPGAAGVMFITKEAFNPLDRRGEPVLLAGRQRAVRPRDRAPVLGPRREDAEPTRSSG